MNILFEIADKDIIFIGLFGVGIVIFGVIIFYVLSRSEKKDSYEEIVEEEQPKVKEEIVQKKKPVTKEQQEAKEELERVFMQMSSDLEDKQTSSSHIRDFEREQEENAIISYKELIKQAEAKRNNPLKDFAELEEIQEQGEQKKETGFKTSEIISPIFGTQKPEEYKEDMRKKKKNLYEDTTNLEFLKNLKDFRDNL
ncbi:MAG: hypothetical protein IKE75_06555 [Bacilli bacterium]|nr:hypothetical protein [Bacilli bacterium]